MNDNNFTNLNEIFHIFSKSPVANGQTLATARNKSGHTVTTSDVWAEDIPAFFSASTQKDFEKFKSLAKDNDLCYYDIEKSIFYFKKEQWMKRNALSDGELLANYEASKLGIYNDGSIKDESQAVVKYHENRNAVAITSDNNNGADSNGLSARIRIDKENPSSSFVPQFISSMDKIVDGTPSTYYEPVVNGGNITEDIEDKGNTRKYIANNYAGIIQFHHYEENFLDSVTISAFEYIGKKLDGFLENFTSGHGAGDFLDIDDDDNLYVKTSSVIEDNAETVPTTQAVYEHTSNTEIHLLNDISEANISDGQTAVGETMHGFVLSPNYNVRITKIRIVQTSF